MNLKIKIATKINF